jgi:hypothetical protein
MGFEPMRAEPMHFRSTRSRPSVPTLHKQHFEAASVAAGAASVSIPSRKPLAPKTVSIPATKAPNPKALRGGLRVSIQAHAADKKMFPSFFLAGSIGMPGSTPRLPARYSSTRVPIHVRAEHAGWSSRVLRLIIINN